jgi:DNA-binding NtrC family response regulator
MRDSGVIFDSAPAVGLEPAGRILVVDDDPATRASLNGLLAADFVVHTVASVAEALYVLPTDTFDVVLTDYEMPGANGLALAETVNREFPGVMVILLTGHPDLSAVKRAETNRTVARVLSKPYDPRRLLSWLHSTVKLARMSRMTARLAEATRNLGAR